MRGSTLRWMLPLAFATSFALVSAARGNVLIVGPGGFSQIQDAVVAAWFQGLAWHVDGKRTIGSFAVVTVLDSAF